MKPSVCINASSPFRALTVSLKIIQSLSLNKIVKYSFLVEIFNYSSTQINN